MLFVINFYPIFIQENFCGHFKWDTVLFEIEGGLFSSHSNCIAITAHSYL